jgi:putative ABC transport system ATP-binding protein
MSDKSLVAGALTGQGLVLLNGADRILDDVSVTARAGRLLAVTGSSGSGKTTLLSVLGGLVAPADGFVEYDGRRVDHRLGEPPEGTAFVLQTYGLVPSLSALENVSVALRARRTEPAAADRAALSALERLGVGDLADRLIAELSGGQLQRVAIARALVVEPDVLLADEPTSELDEKNRDLVVEVLREQAERGAVVVVATHDPDVAALCDDEVHLVDGQVAGRQLESVPTALEGPGHEHDAFRRPGGAR